MLFVFETVQYHNSCTQTTNHKPNNLCVGNEDTST